MFTSLVASVIEVTKINYFLFLPYILNQIGGGSLRIYKREVQEKVLDIVGISREQVSWLLALHPVIVQFYDVFPFLQKEPMCLWYRPDYALKFTFLI